MIQCGYTSSILLRQKCETKCLRLDKVCNQERVIMARIRYLITAEKYWDDISFSEYHCWLSLIPSFDMNCCWMVSFLICLLLFELLMLWKTWVSKNYFLSFDFLVKRRFHENLFGNYWKIGRDNNSSKVIIGDLD